jgi:radical SAM superfamily enzyme YgiQ (UPF0313 family)
VNPNGQLCVKLIHCGNHSLANPEDQCEKNIFFIPMGLFALASALVKSGVDAEIINSDSEKGKSIREVLEFDHLDAVAFDCHWVNQSLAVLETAKLIKSIEPEVFVFLGGFTASLFAEEILEGYPQIDAVLRGDADVPIVRLCKALHGRIPPDDAAVGAAGLRSLSDVPNLVWRGDDGSIRVNPLSYVATAEDLEQLDFASLELLRHWEYYRKRSIYWTRFAPFHFSPLNLSPLFFLEVGRGCRNTCVFCGGNSEAQRVISNRRGVAFRSVDSAIATIQKAMSFGFRTFLTDFEFEGSDEWYGRLFEAIAAEKLEIHYVFSCWRLLSRDLVDALSQSFEKAFVQLSPETADLDLRRENKGQRSLYTNDELRECLDYIGTKDNLKVQLYFGYFLAFETAATVLDTLRFIMNLLLEYPDLIEVAYLPFSTDPGSLLFFHPERYNVDMDVRSFHDYVAKLEETYVAQEMPAPDMRLFKPKDMSETAAIELETKIELFNQLFRSHRRSVSYVLQKTGDPEVILEILRELDIPIAPDVSRAIETALMDVCQRLDVTDAHLVEIIGAESEKAGKRGRQTIKARPQIWLDCPTATSNQEDEMGLVHA